MSSRLPLPQTPPRLGKSSRTGTTSSEPSMLSTVRQCPVTQNSPIETIGAFGQKYDQFSDTLKILWRISKLADRDCKPIKSPTFRSCVDEVNEFWLELSFATVAADSSTENGDEAKSTLSSLVARLHICRTPGSEIGLKYLIGLGGPHGTMKLLTQDGRFQSQKERFGGTVVQRSKLLNPSASYIAADGSLRVYAELRILGLQPQHDRWSRDRLFHLMLQKNFTDMTVESEGISFRTHRLLVASSSPSFFELIKQQEVSGKDCNIKLDEEMKVVKQWLHFLLTGSVDGLTEDEAFKLMNFSRIHQVPSLWIATQKKLSAGLTTGNVIRVTRHAHLNNCTALLADCKTFIGKHAKDITDWGELFDDPASRELFQMVFTVLRPQ